jgi:hypothetical protein
MSIYKDYQREPSRQRQCMQHSEKDGIRCRATAMHNEIMCFQHRSDDIPTVLQNDPFDIAHLDDRAAIQRALADTAARLACNHIDLKRAALLIQNLQVASSNLTAHEKAGGTLPFTRPKQEFAPDPILPPNRDEDAEEDAAVHYNSNAPEMVVIRKPRRPRPAPAAPEPAIPPTDNQVEGEAKDAATTSDAVTPDAVIAEDEDEDKDVVTPTSDTVTAPAAVIAEEKDAVILSEARSAQSKDPETSSPTPTDRPVPQPQPTTNHQQPTTIPTLRATASPTQSHAALRLPNKNARCKHLPAADDHLQTAQRKAIDAKQLHSTAVWPMEWSCDLLKLLRFRNL